ncbi:MAG: hypothetical protein DRI61_13760 [Chloroflexi bacterium]|nr:MAG: hypothetical protein DRI61_13760 [Chloroflexota bacterium]
MELKQRIQEELRGLERLALSIPGFKGYKDKELRREADRLLRQHVARKLEEVKDQLQELQLTYISAGKIGLIDDVERAVMKLQNVIDRLKTASYGYTGFFDAVKVKEEELDALYSFDQAMLDKVEAIGESVKKLRETEARGEELIKLIAGVIAEADVLMDAFKRRQEAITGFSGG